MLHALHGGGRFSYAASMGPLWEPRKAIVASCNRDSRVDLLEAMEAANTGKPYRHVAPEPRCVCGFYAARLLRNAQFPAEPFAYGLVALWGRVEEHQDGWRAQYAYPVNLTIIADRDAKRSLELLQTIRTAYGVPARLGTEEELELLKVEQLATEPLPPQITALATWICGPALE